MGAGEDTTGGESKLRKSEFVGGLDFYPGVIAGIEELLAEVAPHAERLDAPDRLWAPLREALRNVPESRSEDVTRTLQPHFGSDTIYVGPLLRDVIDAYLGEPWGPGLVMGLKESFSRRPRTPILLNSLLTNAVSSFELHLGDVAGSIFAAAPESLEASAREPEFSLRDLKELGSIEDAFGMAVARRVDNLARGNLGEWRKHFRDSVKIDISDLAIDYAALQEIMQRRNAIVHHDAKVSTQYLRTTGRTDVSLGEDLSCEVEYVTAALDEMLTVGFLLSLECFRKFHKDEEYACRRLHEFEERLLPKGRWRMMEKVSSHGLSYDDDAMGLAVFQVNVWLARKNMHGLGSVREEVEKWDVTASDELLVLAKACLLGDLDRAYSLLPRLVDSDALGGSDVLEWPLFEEVRADPRFGSLKDSIRSSVVEAESKDFVAAPGSPVYHRRDCVRAGANAKPIDSGETGTRRAARCCTSEGPWSTPAAALST